MTDSWDHAVRTVLAPAHELEPTEEEVQRVLELDRRRRARRRTRVHRLAAAACAAAILGAGAYAVPVTRAAMDDVFSSIAPWAGGDDDDQAPGRPVSPGDDAPDWVRQAPGAKRVIAENGGVKLFAVREGDGKLSVALGDSVGLTSTLDGWRERFANQAIVVLGPAAFPDGPLDALGRRPLLGLVARSVTRVELRYESGEPTSEDGLHGGFVLLANAAERPRALVGFDAAGREVDRLDVSDLELQICTDVRGCPPGRRRP